MERASLPPVVEALLAAPALTGKSGREFKHTGSLSTRNNLQLLSALLQVSKPQRTLEIGLGFGASCLLLAAYHRGRGDLSCGQHSTVDPLQNSHLDGAGICVIEAAGLDPYVSFIERPSAIALPQMVESGLRFGLIYVDGSHLFEDVFVDSYFSLWLLEPGGIVAFDDCTDPHVSKCIRFLRRNAMHCLREIDLLPYRKDPIKYRVARWVGRTQFVAFERIGEPGRPWDSKLQDF